MTGVSVEVIEQVRGFVTGNFYVPSQTRLSDDTSLIESGIVDSTGMLEVILFIEAAFGIHVDDVEMIPENLETIAGIASFVEHKLATTPAG
jgi:acyl carrier protein